MLIIIFLALVAKLILGEDAIEQLPLSIVNIDDVLELGRTITGNDYNIKNTKENEKYKSLTENIEAWSKLYKRFGPHVESEIRMMLDMYLNKDEISMDLLNKKEKLLNDFHLVDQFYHDSFKYAYNESDYETKLNFTKRILIELNNLPTLLTRIHEEFNSSSNQPQGFLSVLVQKAEEYGSLDCNKSASSQQLFHFIYTQLIINELMGLAALKRVTTMDIYLFKHDELNSSRVSFELRVRDYHRIFNQHMHMLPQQIHKCHVDTPIRGLHFIELQKFSQIKFLEPDSKKRNCDSCPHPLMIDEIARQKGTEIYDCTTLGHTVEVCPAEIGSVRSYLWWKDEAGNYYGHQTPCPNKKNITAGYNIDSTANSNKKMMKLCAICACSVDQRWRLQYDYQEISHFSAVDQISDIWNNMVVTGVKFVEWEGAIALQIQESKFTGLGTIHRNPIWKMVNSMYHQNGTTGKQLLMVRYRITSHRKTMFLDDIKVPEGFVITGVRLVDIGHEAFGLNVHATKFNFVTGKLDPADSFWCESSVCNNKPPTNDYKRERIEIEMHQPDDPTRGTAFNYDPESNKMIKFTHTDIHKDAGQTTVPFFDAQPVHSQPVFPLSGIGLYYRGKEGFGGYISPRIFTFDVSRNRLV